MNILSFASIETRRRHRKEEYETPTNSTKQRDRTVNIFDFWKAEFGDETEAWDYAGRKVCLNRFGQYGHRYGWVIEEISLASADIASNMHIVNVSTELARHGRSDYSDGAAQYKVERRFHSHGIYNYAHKDFCMSARFQSEIWLREFGEKETAIDFAGKVIQRNKFGQATEGGWNVDHIRPLSRGGQDVFTNMQISSVAVNDFKANWLKFALDGHTYTVMRSVEADEKSWLSTPYDYIRKEYCLVKGEK